MVTFSRRAAGEMRDRVTARLGRTVREPIARTLHSYAFGVLRMADRRQGAAGAPAAVRRRAGRDPARTARGRDPARVAGRAAPGAAAPAASPSELRDLLMRAVERGLDGPALAELGRCARSARLGRRRQSSCASTRTSPSLARPGGVRPGRADPRGARASCAPTRELLAAERARRRHIFVDEYQDTDPAQAELLALLADGADELVLVGDPDQSIYAFRGADESAIRDVDERFGRRRAGPDRRAERLAPVGAGAARGVAADRRTAARPAPSSASWSPTRG